MAIWVFFFLFGWLASASDSERAEDIYLWKGKHSLIDETISIPHPLIVTSYTQPIASDIFQRVNKILKAPYLDGGQCSLNKDPYFSRRVEGILPPKTPLAVIKAFYVLKKSGLFRKLILKLIDFMEIPGKGGPEIYYLVRTLKNQEFIIASSTYFYTYGSLQAKKAACIISDFTEGDEEIQRVLLRFELSKTHDEKCGYGWPKGQEPKRIKPTEETKILMKRTLRIIEENRSVYTFKKVNNHINQIEVDIDYKSLAFLILNSSPLRIKDISLID